MDRAPLTSLPPPFVLLPSFVNAARDLVEIIVALSFWIDTHLPPLHVWYKYVYL